MKKKEIFSKSRVRANKIRKKMLDKIKKGELNLGVWTPDTLSNRCVIKHYSFLLRKDGDKND